MKRRAAQGIQDKVFKALSVQRERPERDLRAIWDRPEKEIRRLKATDKLGKPSNKKIKKM